MDISEAVREVHAHGGAITSNGYKAAKIELRLNKRTGAVGLFDTETKEQLGCWWNPTARDFMANDWEVVTAGGENK